MKALVLCLVSSLAFAQDPPADAPKAEARPAQVVPAGFVMPWPGVVMDDARAMLEAGEKKGCRAELEVAHDGILFSKPAFIALVGGSAAAVIGAIVAGVVLATVPRSAK